MCNPVGVSQGLDAAFCEEGKGEVPDSALQQISTAVAEFVGALSRDELAACTLLRPEPVSPAQLAALARHEVAVPARSASAPDTDSPEQPAAPGAGGDLSAHPSQHTADASLELASQRSADVMRAASGETDAEPPAVHVSEV